MVIKKAAKKAVSKTDKRDIDIELKEGYTQEDLCFAITPAIFRRLRAAHKHCKKVGVFISEKIP